MNINKLLGVRYPIIQGGMANMTNGQFAAALSNAGVLGTIGAGGMKPDTLKEEIAICRSKTDKPFAVNLIMFRRDIEEMVDVVCEAKVPFVIAGAASPAPFMEKFEAAGVKVIPVVSSPIQIKRLDKLNVLAYIVEGMEAGGHIGEMTSMTLIYQARQTTDKPVIAAGGIGSGAQMLAAEVLGADGVQIGTAFLFTKESPTHENYKNALINATATRVTQIGYINGRPMRVLKNAMAREFLRLEKEEENKELLETFTLGRLKKAVVEGDVQQGSVMCGYTVAQFDKICSAQEMVDRLIGEYKEAKEKIKAGA
ncbi:MAG: NAD(P)H-dependent flavin oxidoreductase [Candidatus Alectryocaccobium sp.]|jgi:enoyl-[acyl-carrier protein] reductase II|nr:nitronate monooxygenase [Candidatus Alectryocaccobium sp.]